MMCCVGSVVYRNVLVRMLDCDMGIRMTENKTFKIH